MLIAYKAKNIGTLEIKELKHIFWWATLAAWHDSLLGEQLQHLPLRVLRAVTLCNVLMWLSSLKVDRTSLVIIS